MAYWHQTLGNTKVQKKNLRLQQDPLPMSGHGFLFHHPLVCWKWVETDYDILQIF